MRLRIFILLMTIGAICSACFSRQKQEGENYGIIVSYKDRLKSNWAEQQIEGDKLYLFFEVYYTADTISVKTNLDDKPKIIYLTTNPINDMAEVIEFNDFETIKWIEIRKNKGEPLKFEIKENWMNKWAINYYKGTLRACPLNFAPFYD